MNRKIKVCYYNKCGKLNIPDVCNINKFTLYFTSTDETVFLFIA